MQPVNTLPRPAPPGRLGKPPGTLATPRTARIRNWTSSQRASRVSFITGALLLVPTPPVQPIIFPVPQSTAVYLLEALQFARWCLAVAYSVAARPQPLYSLHQHIALVSPPLLCCIPLAAQATSRPSPCGKWTHDIQLLGSALRVRSKTCIVLALPLQLVPVRRLDRYGRGARVLHACCRTGAHASFHHLFLRTPVALSLLAS